MRWLAGLSRNAAGAAGGEAPLAEALHRSTLLAVLVLAGLGLVMIYSATAPISLEARIPAHFLRHGAALALGACLVAGASRIRIRGWHALALPLWALALLALAATAAFGVRVNGAQRWLELPGLGLTFQPAELAKLATVLAVARVVARRKSRGPLSTRRFAGAIALGVLPAGLLLAQPDLGNALLLSMLVGLLLFAAGTRPWQLLLPATLVGIGLGGYVVAQPYAYRRWVGFLDPWATSANQGFQLVQSFVAFGRGGPTGVGWGYGRQKLHYLPEAHTDFILSVIAEELGLVGVLVVLLAFAALLVAGVRIALRARQRFSMLLAFGMTLLLTVPALVNAAVVMGILPTKGLTLPFLSYGRSSLLMCCVAVGALLAVAREKGRADPVPAVASPATRSPRPAKAAGRSSASSRSSASNRTGRRKPRRRSSRSR